MRKSKWFSIFFGLCAICMAAIWAMSYESSIPAPGPLALPSYSLLLYPTAQSCIYVSVLNGWTRFGLLRVNKPFKPPRRNDKEVWPWLGSARIPDPEWVAMGWGNEWLGGLILICDYPYASGRMGGIAVPCPLLMMFILGSYLSCIGAARRLQIKRRKRRNQCVDCAYDLTGNASGVCPECGTEISSGSSGTLQ